MGKVPKSPIENAANATFKEPVAPVAPPRMFYELESIFVSVRQMETALRQVQDQNLELKAQLESSQQTHRENVLEANRRIQILNQSVTKLKSELSQRQSTEGKLVIQVRSLESSLKSAKSELDQRAGLEQELRMAVERESRKALNSVEDSKKFSLSVEKIQLDLKSKVTQLTMALEDARSSLEQERVLRKKHENEIRALLARANQLTLERDSLESKYNQAINEVKIRDAELTRYRKAWSEIVARDRENTSRMANDEAIKLRQNEILAQKDTEIFGLKEKLENEKDRSRVSTQELGEIKLRNQILEEEVISLAKSLDAANKEAVRATTELEKSRATLSEELTRAEKQVSSMESKFVELQTQLLAARNDSARISRKLDEVSARSSKTSGTSAERLTPPPPPRSPSA